MTLVTHAQKLYKTIAQIMKKRNIPAIALAGLFISIIFSLCWFVWVIFYIISQVDALSWRMVWEAALYSLGLGSIVGVLGAFVLLLDYFYRKLFGDYKIGNDQENGHA